MKLPFRGAHFCWARETAPQKQRCVLWGASWPLTSPSWAAPFLPWAAGLAEFGGGGPHVRSRPPAPGCKRTHPPLPCVLQGGDRVHQAGRLSPEAVSTSEGQEEGIEGERPCRPPGLSSAEPRGPLSPLSKMSHVTCRWGRWGPCGRPPPARVLGQAGFAFPRLKGGALGGGCSLGRGPTPRSSASSSPCELAGARARAPSLEPWEVWRSWQREPARTPSPKGPPRRAERPRLVWTQGSAPAERVLGPGRAPPSRDVTRTLLGAQSP